jgi:serine/threonine protein kinase
MKAESSRLLPIAESLKKGDVIDGYTLHRSFHQTDRVWLAEKDGQRWVLKFAPTEAARDEVRLSQFIRESWRATDLLGEFAPLAFVPAEATLRYYVMEFFDVPHLQTFLTVRKLSVDEVVSLGLFLTTAAQSLLRHDLVHGDIKPENILIIENQEQPTWKLIDLGSCTEVFSTTSRAGTASYLAPERFEQAPISERSEIYAIGVTLYQALTGKLPQGEIERFQTPRFRHPPPPSQHNPNVPPWLDSVILRSISNDSERRYQNYSELAFDLASPQKVRPFYPPGQPLLARNPLGFYRTGFYVLLVVTLGLLIRIWSE